jgi:hypothetical protein
MDTTPPLQTPDHIRSLKVLYHLPQARAMALHMLLTNQVCTVQEIAEAGVAPTVASARVVMHRLKKFLDAHGTELQSGKETGYWLTNESKEIFRKEIHEFNYPTR